MALPPTWPAGSRAWARQWPFWAGSGRTTSVCLCVHTFDLEELDNWTNARFYVAGIRQVSKSLIDWDHVHIHMNWVGTGAEFRQVFAARGVNTQALQWDKVSPVEQEKTTKACAFSSMYVLIRTFHPIS